MGEEINQQRRRFIGAAALTVAAARLGVSEFQYRPFLAAARTVTKVSTDTIV